MKYYANIVPLSLENKNRESEVILVVLIIFGWIKTGTTTSLQRK